MSHESLTQKEDFRHDVIFRCSPQDKSVVRSAASRLSRDGLRVWFDGENSSDDAALPQEVLKHSRVLVLAISQHTFGEQWSALESETFQFRDPTEEERRFIPLRLDDSPIHESVKQFAYVDFRKRRDVDYLRLLAACRPPPPPPKVNPSDILKFKELPIGDERVTAFAMSVDGKLAATGFLDGRVQLWMIDAGVCLRTFRNHRERIKDLSFSQDGTRIAASSNEGRFCVWALDSFKCLGTWEGFEGYLQCLGRTTRGWCAVSASFDSRIYLWNLLTGDPRTCLSGHAGMVHSAALTPDGRYLISGSDSGDVHLWDLNLKTPPKDLREHTDTVYGVAISADGRRAVSCSADRTIKLWNLRQLLAEATLEGHTERIKELSMTADGRWAVSASDDQTIRIWNLDRGVCVLVAGGVSQKLTSLQISVCGRRLAYADIAGGIGIYDIPSNLEELVGALDTTRYTNAKVLLAGESGVGKTGLAQRLSANSFTPSISTDGAWATQLKLPYHTDRPDIEREIWLWDFAGQADYRLIHQLYMDETSLAVLVFNPQSHDPFDGLGQWDKDLQHASRRPFHRILVAARCDRGGLMVSQESVRLFMRERDFRDYIETSALTGDGCNRLFDAIIENIPWKIIPWRASPRIFRLLKDEIVRLKDRGTVLLRLVELKQQLEIGLPGQRFSIQELQAVVALLAGPGIVWQLEFGDFLLLQPEIINSYAAAVIRTVRGHTEEIGCIEEEDVLKGNLDYQTLERLAREEEQIVLRAMHQTLVDHGLCLREPTEHGTLLVFPSYFKRERPALENHPATLVTYHFSGPLDEIYATLVVRLYHIRPFSKDRLWRYAADFKTESGRRLGFKMTKVAEGSGSMDVYFEPGIAEDTQVTFVRYIHEHLLSKAQEVRRRRHYICLHCHTPIESQRAIEKRLAAGKSDVLCPTCEKRVPLIDIIEEKFASDEFLKRVRELDQQAKAAIDNESRELILVGHTYAIAGEAGQIYRQYTNSDHGIDGEIEFKDAIGKASGKRLYLQLKSGDSYLYRRESDGAEIFTIKNERHADYWQKQNYPVMLVVRTTEKGIRWMDIGEYLKREAAAQKSVKQVIFVGEPFTAINLRKARDRIIGI